MQIGLKTTFWYGKIETRKQRKGMNPVELLKLLLTGSVGAGLMVLIQKGIERHWQKKDKQEEREEMTDAETRALMLALVENAKIMTIDRFRWLVQKYIEAGEMTLSDRENMEDMYRSYKALGGNGHLETAVTEMRKIPVLPD